MNEYVRLEEVTKIIEEQIRKRNCLEMGGTDRTVLNVLQVVKTRIWKLDIVEAEPVRHGRWVPVDGEAPCDEWDCTACGRRMTFMVDMDEDDMAENYWRCPKCGAKMDGGVEDD